MDSSFEQYVYVNQNDPNLKPIRIDVLWLYNKILSNWEMPYISDFSKIKKLDGWQNKKEDQVFSLPKIPNNLLDLQERCIEKYEDDTRDLDFTNSNKRKEMFFNELKSNDSYKKSIEWLREHFTRCKIGAFFMNNGTLTYLPPSHYRALTEWKGEHTKDDGRLEYRDAQRKIMLFTDFCRNDTFDLEQDSEGNPIVDKDGFPLLVDTGIRKCMGAVIGKPRRIGYTVYTMADTVNNMCNIISTGLYPRFGFQSCDSQHGKGLFENYFLRPIRSMPLWSIPYITTRAGEVRFHGIDKFNKSKFATFSYASSQKAGHFDGKYLDVYINDESAKLQMESIYNVHGVIAKTMQNSRQHFFASMVYYSTIEEISSDNPKNEAKASKSGQEYLKLCFDSDYWERNKIGETTTGLYFGVFSSYEGRNGYIDKYGNSIIENPTEEQQEILRRNRINPKFGAREILQTTRDELLKRGDIREYNKECRREIMNSEDMKKSFQKESSFDLDVLHHIKDRIFSLEESGSNPIIKGDFVREGLNPEGKVIFRPDDKGKFYLSKFFDNDFLYNYANKYNTRAGQREPILDKDGMYFVASADPVRNNKVKTGSQCAFVMKYCYDPYKDSPQKDIDNWESDTIILDYIARESKTSATDIFAEDCMMACEYFGAYIYPESDVDAVSDYFEKRGRAGYLLYNSFCGKITDNTPAGFKSRGSKDKMLLLMKSDLEKNKNRFLHKRIIEQLERISSTDDFKSNDLVVAYGGTLLAEKHTNIKNFLQKAATSNESINLHKFKISDY